MPRPHVFRSLALPAAAVSALVLSMSGCRHPSRSHEMPSPSAVPSSATVDPDRDFRPLHPGHRNQRDPKGGFLPALTAPLPAMVAAIKATIFDNLPPEIRLAALKSENGHCGELEIAGEKIVLDCMGDDYSMFPGAAQHVASGDDLTAFRTSRKLPAVVDHRKENTEGIVMDQGKSSSCTAFSLTSAVDHAAAHFLGQPPTLSPMHAWARYHSPNMRAAEADNLNKGLADMATFPFDARLAQEWARSEKRVDLRELHHADEKALVEITNITRLDAGSMNEIKSALAAGQDVWFSLKAAHGLMHPKKNSDGESMVPDFDYRKSGGSKGGHAILLAGYEDLPKGTFFLIHNSWGPKWGTDGYAWIWEKTLRTNIGDAYVVQVRPTELAHAKRVPAEHKFSRCGVGLAPDAVTTQCVPACSDKGPRVNGVCPAPGQCPDGEVNLDGRCELAAPAVHKTLANGTKVVCGQSGCVYVVPSGQSSCSSDDGCSISCAAPKYMLASGPHGLACTG